LQPPRSSQRSLGRARLLVLVLLTFLSLAVVYLHACSDRATHSVPAYTAPHHRTYGCRSDGSLDFCSRENCQMRWKPPGTHHCSTCGVCRLGFDHHCPSVSKAPASNPSRLQLTPSQLGNCVTTGRMKAFLTLLAVTSVTVPLASLPILAVLKATS
jgi:hypothetical protein